MDIGQHQKLASFNWDHQLQQPYNMAAMESDHGNINNMLLHQGQNPHHHHHEIIPYEQLELPQWPNYNPPVQNQPQNVPLEEDGELRLPLGDLEEDPEEELGAMKEMMFKMAAMQPVDIDPATIRKPKRRNVRISEDPQSVAARHRREKISEKIRILQRLVPGGTKMDTASMLDEAVKYVKYLKKQIRTLQVLGTNPQYEANVGPASAPPEADWLVAAAGAGNNPPQVNHVGTSYDFFGGNNVSAAAHDHGSICFNP